ncbi:hypothetical protein AB0948_22250 [Streptomyces koyangensis]|uniref:hypothetical protein n=1 Tax=Streptomyces koyangensis TaxID=188770 RepID=UPI003451D418
MPTKSDHGRTTAGPPSPPPHPRPRTPLALGLAALLATAAWFLYADPAPPYALRPGPEVRLDLEQAPDARAYPDAAEIQPGVELLTRVYLQRLAAGDRRGLAELGAPWYTGREAAAGEWIGAYGSGGGGPVTGVLQDPVAPDLATVELRFADGREQRVGLVRGDGTWWLSLGDGNPAGADGDQ